MIPTLNQLSKGEIGNVHKVLERVNRPKFLDTELNEKDRPIRIMDFDHTPTMDEMCRKYGESFIAVLRKNKWMKSLHREEKNGFALGRNIHRFRYTAEIPIQISGNPRNPLYWQYFHPMCTDPVERRKNLYKFLRKYDMAFSPIDRL